jgi:thiamine-phosphate pyrophosphorylase
MSLRPGHRLPCTILCLVTQRSYASKQTLPNLVSTTIESGVNMVQLRERDLPFEELLILALQLRIVTREKALFFVNGNVKVAMESEADGIQLGEKDASVKSVRNVVGKDIVIGRSVHSVDGALMAEHQGADILTVGTIFPTLSKPGIDAGGPDLLKRVAGTVTIPFLAIGGIDEEKAAQAMQAGCQGVAVISAILGSSNPEQATRAIWKEISEAKISPRSSNKTRG